MYDCMPCPYPCPWKFDFDLNIWSIQISRNSHSLLTSVTFDRQNVPNKLSTLSGGGWLGTATDELNAIPGYWISCDQSSPPYPPLGSIPALEVISCFNETRYIHTCNRERPPPKKDKCQAAQRISPPLLHTLHHQAYQDPFPLSAEPLRTNGQKLVPPICLSNRARLVGIPVAIWRTRYKGMGRLEQPGEGVLPIWDYASPGDLTAAASL